MSREKQQEEEAIRDVFIAHVEEDADIALEIALGLEEAGYSTWCYELDGIPGASYLLQTGQAVANSKAVVVVISPHSVGSRQVTREIVRAHESDKDFIPVRRGISHIEFQNRQPEWREAIGATTSIGIPEEGAAGILPRIIAGLKNLGIQPAAKADSARIEQIYKEISELPVPTQGPELEHGPVEVEKGTTDLAVHVERPVKGRKRLSNLRWFLIAGVLLWLGVIWAIAVTADYSPSRDGPWYGISFAILLIFGVPLIVSGAYCLRRGIAQTHLSKLAQGKSSGWWWVLPVVLGFVGGTIAWLKQRDVDWRKASNLLTLGIVLSVFWTIPFLAGKASVGPTLYTLTTNISPPGAGSVSPSSGEYESGVQVTLTANPASGYIFDHWSGSASGTTSNITITMDSDKSLTAHFIPTVPDDFFSDDFSDESSGWDAGNVSGGQASYRDGCFYMKDYTDEYFISSESHHYFTDFVLEVETWLVGGTDENLHTVLCRYSQDNFYSFAIGANGYYKIWKEVDDNIINIVEKTYSPYIHQGVGAVNLIHIECIGDSLSLSVNEHLLWEDTDDSFTGGDIALGANARAGTFTEIAFDNIIVTKPEVLFSDDFSDPGSGWNTRDDSYGRVIYGDGYLYLKDYTDGWAILSRPHDYFSDFILEVETWLVDGTDDNSHVVFCRYSVDNSYGFAISADGYYRVWKEVDDYVTGLVEPTYSSYINQGVGAVNLIHIACIGSSLSLSVNGHLLWEGTDSTFTGGDIALGADANAGTFTEVAFDNIIVYGIG